MSVVNQAIYITHLFRRESSKNTQRTQRGSLVTSQCGSENAKLHLLSKESTQRHTDYGGTKCNVVFGQQNITTVKIMSLKRKNKSCKVLERDKKTSRPSCSTGVARTSVSR
jgi:hypothetical protein